MDLMEYIGIVVTLTVLTVLGHLIGRFVGMPALLDPVRDYSDSNFKCRQSSRKADENSQDQRHKINQGVNNALALDCEIICGKRPGIKFIRRVSIVDSDGIMLFDEAVKLPKRMKNEVRLCGTHRLIFKKGVRFSKAQRTVKAFLEDCILVGHNVKHNLKALRIECGQERIRDISLYPPFRALVQGSTPSLKHLTRIILGKKIQQGERSSIQDARMAMLIYNAHKNDWESLGNDM